MAKIIRIEGVEIVGTPADAMEWIKLVSESAGATIVKITGLKITVPRQKMVLTAKPEAGIESYVQ